MSRRLLPGWAGLILLLVSAAALSIALGPGGLQGTNMGAVMNLRLRPSVRSPIVGSIAWGATPDRLEPNFYLQTMMHSSFAKLGERNYGHYRSAKYDAACDVQMREMDPEKRVKLVWDGLVALRPALEPHECVACRQRQPVIAIITPIPQIKLPEQRSRD